MTSSVLPDSDRPLEQDDDDRLGFVDIAKQLAPVLLNTLDGDGMVVGLEGPWGSGKTTLLNYLRAELREIKRPNVHVITLAPWLVGDASSIVASLIEPIADVVDAANKATKTNKRCWWGRATTSLDGLGSLLRSYGAKTGRTLAPVAQFTGNFVPEAKILGEALELGSDYLDEASRNPTTAEQKAEISRKITELGISFIVILDDIDRLEPAQAVEVVRLVRSVADFPKITYLMCYDREILSQALSSRLNLKNGDLFLQKIVQLTFAIPLPEPFDLRRLFLEGARKIFNADGAILVDLRNAVDREGAGLRNPREVKLALNGIRFVYPAVKEDVYFPDMCRLHLIKVVNPQLYRWLEDYLSIRSVILNENVSVGDHDKIRLGKQLKEICQSEEIRTMRSISDLGTFIPALADSEVAKETVFTRSSLEDVQEMEIQRRLGSPFHYRYYFALNPPNTVMSNEKLALLLGLAEREHRKLTEELARLASERRISGRTWFEHVLDRLGDTRIESVDAQIVCGLAVAVSDAMDTVLRSNRQPGPFSLSVERKALLVVKNCLRKLKMTNREMYQVATDHLVVNCTSLNWIVGTFFRTQINDHGLVGKQEYPPETLILSQEELDTSLKKLRERVGREEVRSSIGEMPDIASYLFGWRDLTDLDTVKAWVKKFSDSDENFLKLLRHLQTRVFSDGVYYILRKHSVAQFLDWNLTLKRLKRLRGSEYKNEVEELELAVEEGKKF